VSTFLTLQWAEWAARAGLRVLPRSRSSEHPFVTSQGHAYGRFRRALDRGNVTEALSAASELRHVGLSEALELCLLVRDKAPQRYARAALRWRARSACQGPATHPGHEAGAERVG
jgi:hypothetical protein